jgi:hypothetical protein
MSQDQSQPYDRALKSLLGDEVAEILPNLLPESEFLSEQNIEIDRTTLRADLVYNIQYRGSPHILNMELQTDPDNEMAIRMLKYHVGLYDKHRLPVISMVIYPFETTIPELPFRETSGGEDLLTFHYRVLPLWRLDAQQFVRDHVVSMYTFLPDMKGANASLLIQAINEMKQRYKRPQLVRHLTRFRIILHRTKILAEQDKQSVEEYMHQYQYDSLLDEDPEIQERIARGKVEALQETVIMAVENKFPSLVELAQERVVLIEKLDALRQLVMLILNAPNEDTARWLLNTFKA